MRQRLGDLSSAVNKEQSKLISVRDKNDTMKVPRAKAQPALPPTLCSCAFTL